QRYQGNIADARAALGQEAPEIDYCPEWHAHPLFIQTWVEEIRRTFAGSHNQGDETALLFTAHSLPIPMAQQSPYVDQLQTQTRMIAERLGCQHWSIAYQSRSGKPSDPWLEPDVYQVIRNFAAQGMRRLIVAPIGFVCDHVEVLYDLDIDARKFAEQLGLRFYRAHCPNDRPTFIQMMAEVVKGQLAGD
ncbi:MAG TPA: ferrochelatase, partial [Terriglobales bacterium]|nr:ferrochelatase [Terriglobales bacterium]